MMRRGNKRELNGGRVDITFGRRASRFERRLAVTKCDHCNRKFVDALRTYERCERSIREPTVQLRV